MAESGIRARVFSPSDLPSDQTRINTYDAVVLVNIPADSLSLTQQRVLRQYVHDAGGGLIVVGGDQSFGAGGWLGSPLEDALPVRLDPPQKRQMPRGALAMVIHSCEAPRGVYWGKKACEAAVDALSSQDLAGIIEDRGWGDIDWVHTMSTVGDRSALYRSINQLQFGDMPTFDPSLRLALQGLESVDAGQRHCIVISDGDPSLSKSLLPQFRQAGITISAIGIFPHSAGDTSTLQRMARETGGTYYDINNQAGLATIPQIFIKEARTVRRALIWEGDPFAPAMTGVPVENMRGIDGVPPILGYVVTAEREGLSVVTMQAVRTEEHNGRPVAIEDPISAQWQYGLGRVIAFTSDASTKWAPSWTSWMGYGNFGPSRRGGRCGRLARRMCARRTSKTAMRRSS